MMEKAFIFGNMNAWKRNKMSVLLIASSLLLLLFFQLFWLNNVYENEKQTLVDEADQLFMDAVRNIEDSMFYKVLLEPIQEIKALHTDSLNVNVDLRKESQIKILLKQTEQMVSQVEKDTSIVQFDIRSDFQTIEKDKNFGSYIFMMASERDSTHDHGIAQDHEHGHNAYFSNRDTLFPNNSLELIAKKVSNNILITGLPSTYEVVSLGKNNNQKTGLLSSTHTDKFSQKTYAIHFPFYKSHILKTMLPQILFSLFLFGCIAMSFFMVWKSLEKQRRLTTLKNDFISNVTHELKTPITTVGVALEALSNFNALQNPERTEEYLNISKHELSRLSILVDKVLKMSMFEKKEPELKIELLDMQSMILEVLASMKLQFEKVSAQVDFQTKGSQFFLKGDKIHLTSVIYNLIDNALKYSRSNPEISLLLENTSAEVQLTITDKGIGISNPDQGKIFDKFFRVPHGDQHDVKGYGLGLSYVASVVKKHQGDIEVNSKLNEGTSFTISLPNDYE